MTSRFADRLNPRISSPRHRLVAPTRFKRSPPRCPLGTDALQVVQIWRRDGQPPSCRPEPDRAAAVQLKSWSPLRVGFLDAPARHCAGHGMIGTVLIAFAGEPLTSFELIAR